MMHGIFVGEIQALEGAGRTVWDFDDDEARSPSARHGRQCWDRPPHEISVKLGEWMGTRSASSPRTAFLYQAACNPDPVLRLTASTAPRGLAIDVFNTHMREFGASRSRPASFWSALRGLGCGRRGDLAEGWVSRPGPG